ncbi:MAG TPA: FixH family protein [Polyangiaceae bacterium]|nr:FixH family protein [Polyangiaceae bacterium]
MNVATDLNHEDRTTARGLVWAFVPVALLAASVIGVGTMCSIATHDPGFATEKDYYERAVRWDSEQAQWAENARLGYRASVESRPWPGGVELVVRVLDRQGSPVRGATVHAEAFANARSADRHELVLAERTDGGYAVVLPQPRPGLWEIRVRVERDGERFTANLRTDLAAGLAP